MKRPFSFNRFGLAAMLVGAMGLAGCASSQPAVDGEEEVDEEATALEDAATDPEGTDPEGRGGHGMRGMRPGGPEMFLFHEAEALELTAAQRTVVTAARESLRPSHGERGPGPEKLEPLAAAIRQGTIDVAALAPKVGEADPMVGRRAKAVAAIQKLHDTLTTEQRTELVSRIQEKMAAHGGEHDGARDDHRGPGRARGPGGKMDPVAFLLRDLEVGDAQRAKIASALERAGLRRDGDGPSAAELLAMKAKHEAALAAFAKDSFDASVALPEPPAGMKGGPAHFIEALAVVVPLLDGAQREALATRIEQGPPGHGGRMAPPHAGAD